MKRIIFTIIAVMAISFTACSVQEKPIQYNLTICDDALVQIFNELKPTRSPENRVELQNFTQYNILDFIKVDTDENISTLTVYSESLSQEDILSIISFVKERNIPIIFACQFVDSKVLATYDKAFCVTTDYVYAAEVFASKMFELWRDGSIIDRDGNKIFSYTVLKDENSPEYLSTFYTNLIANLEIYGIPLQQNEEVFPAVQEVDSVLETNKGTNEGFLIFSDDMLSTAVQNYQPAGEGFELFSLYRGVNNQFAEYADGQICFVDYTKYFTSQAEIISNYNKRLYPLSDLSFPVNNRTVYIPPTI